MLGDFDDALSRSYRARPAVRLKVAVHEVGFRVRRGRGLQPCIELHGGVVEEVSVRVTGKEVEVVSELRANRGPVALEVLQQVPVVAPVSDDCRVDLPGGLIEGAELFVVVGGTDKEKAACGDDGAAVVFAARVGHAFGSEFGIFAEIYFPGVFAGVEVDGVERSPRRSDGGVAVGIEKSTIAGKAIFRSGRRRGGTGCLFALRAGEKIDETLHLIGR